MDVDRISVIIPVRSNYYWLDLCLRGINLCSTYKNYEVVLVDNDSDVCTKEYLSRLAGDIKVVSLDQNCFWSKSANIGIANASEDSEFFLLMHQDTISLAQNWMEIMLHDFNDPAAAISGALVEEIYFGENNVQYPSESCFLTRRKVFEEYGPFDEEFKLVGPSFAYSTACLKGGQKVFVHHEERLIHHYNVLEPFREVQVARKEDFEVLLNKARQLSV